MAIKYPKSRWDGSSYLDDSRCHYCRKFASVEDDPMHMLMCIYIYGRFYTTLSAERITTHLFGSVEVWDLNSAALKRHYWPMVTPAGLMILAYTLRDVVVAISTSHIGLTIVHISVITSTYGWVLSHDSPGYCPEGCTPRDICLRQRSRATPFHPLECQILNRWSAERDSGGGQCMSRSLGADTCCPEVSTRT